MARFKTLSGLAAEIAECSDMPTILSLFDEFVKDCGAEAAYAFTFSFGEYRKPALMKPLFSSYAEEVLDFYTNNCCVAVDPIVRGALASYKPVKFHQFFHETRKLPLMQGLNLLMRKYGVVDGLAMAVASRPGRLSYVSFGYTHSVRGMSEFEVRRIHACTEMFIRHGASLNGSPNKSEAAAAVSLSRKEYIVVQMLAKGASNKEIARHLNIAPSTVNTLVGRCFEKLGANTRAEAAIVASRLGLALVA